MATSQVGAVTLVAGTPAQLLGPNPRRKGIILGTSVATSPIYIGTGPDVTVAGGFPIMGNGGPVALTERELGDFVKGPIWAISAFVGVIGYIETID